MMDRFKKLFKDFSLKTDIINIFIGIALITSLVIIYLDPNNKYAILAACLAGGLMNMVSGFKMMKNPKRRNLSMSFIMLGVIIIFLGFYIVNTV